MHTVCWITWVKIFRINPEFRVLRLTFHRKSALKCRIRQMIITSFISSPEPKAHGLANSIPVSPVWVSLCRQPPGQVLWRRSPYDNNHAKVDQKLNMLHPRKWRPPLHASGKFCCLLIIFANSLHPNPACAWSGSKLWWYYQVNFSKQFWKISADDNKMVKITKHAGLP